MKHTPTPWYIYKPEAFEQTGELIIKREGDWHFNNIAQVYLNEANAAFIVKAVNNHEKLVDMIRELKDSLGAACNDINSLAEYGGSTANDDARAYRDDLIKAQALLTELEK